MQGTPLRAHWQEGILESRLPEVSPPLSMSVHLSWDPVRLCPCRRAQSTPGVCLCGCVCDYGFAGGCACATLSMPAHQHSLSVCPGLRDLVATQLSMGRLNGCCTLVRMIL